MKNKSSRSITPAKGGILQEIALRAKLMFQLMVDRRVSPWAKLVPLAGLIYWISPIDLIMGIPGLDAVDDVAVLWFVQYLFLELCPPEVVRELTSNLVDNHTVINEVRDDADDIVDGEATDVTDVNNQH